MSRGPGKNFVGCTHRSDRCADEGGCPHEYRQTSRLIPCLPRLATGRMMLTFGDESYWPIGDMLGGLSIVVFTTMQCPNCQSQLSPYAGQCDRCGEEIPAGQHLLEQSGIVEPAPAPEHKSAASSKNKNSGDYRFASLGDRFIAFVLDSAMLFGLFTV